PSLCQEIQSRIGAVDGETFLDKGPFPLMGDDRRIDWAEATTISISLPGRAAVAPLRASSRRMFGPGEVLAERFRVVRFIARGGMGEVYEAVDLELDDHVALKVLTYDRMQDERALERFRREIHLARKVTHPNVCRIYDLFHHRETNSAHQSQGILVLSMELLSG